MKNLFITVALLVLVLISSGCSNKQVLPNSLSYHSYVKNYDIVFRTTLHLDEDVVSVIQNAAAEIEAAAIWARDRNSSYFIIDPKHRIPFMITNFKDLVDYCYPSNNGFHAREFDSKDSNLESGKCKIEYKFTDTDAVGAKIHFWSRKHPQNNMPVWSVDQVLSDPYIQKYKKALIEDAKFKNFKLTYIYKKRI